MIFVSVLLRRNPPPGLRLESELTARRRTGRCLRVCGKRAFFLRSRDRAQHTTRLRVCASSQATRPRPSKASPRISTRESPFAPRCLVLTSSTLNPNLLPRRLRASPSPQENRCENACGQAAATSLDKDSITHMRGRRVDLLRNMVCLVGRLIQSACTNTRNHFEQKSDRSDPEL